MTEQAPLTENELATPQPGPTVCGIHNLRYDSRISVGCVLCRRHIEALTTTTMTPERSVVVPVIIALLVSAALGAFLVLRKEQAGPRFASPAAMVSGSKSAHAMCYSDCAEAHSICIDRCSAKPGDATCGEYCQSAAQSCFTDCAGRQIKADPPWSYYYGTENMPAWSAVLESSLGLHSRLLACSATPPVNTLAHVRVRGQDGTPAGVTLSRRGLSDEAHACAVGVFFGTHFAPSSEGDYTFLARFDARYDGTRLLIAQAESELSALPRLVTDDPGDDLKSRLFDAKLALEKHESAPPASVQMDLRNARLKLAQLKRELSDLQLQRARGGAPRVDPQSQQYAEAEKLQLEQQNRKMTDEERRKRERETREETERYRRLNREYRDEEERAKNRRIWEGYYDDR